MTDRELTDGELIERVGAGDRDAFEELYRRYTRPVLGLALRRLGDRGRAEDALQDAFAAIWRSAAQLRPGSAAPGGAWLYTVARNAIIDGARRRPEPPVEAPDEAGRERRPGRARRGSWLSWRVHRAIEELPEHERPVIELAYWSGLSQSEIAGRLRRPARDGEDADADRARAAGGPARGGAAVKRASTTDRRHRGSPAEERDALRRVHELLLAGDAAAGRAAAPAAPLRSRRARLRQRRRSHARPR